MKYSTIALIVFPSFLIACEGLLVGDDATDSPENNFQILWEEFDRAYAGFGVRNIDWDSLYVVYRSQVMPQTSNDELWGIVTGMLTPLRDLHTSVDDPRTRRFFNAGNPTGLPDPLDFDLQLVRERYLSNSFQQAGEGRLVYGQVSGTIGYLYISNFEGPDTGTDPPAWTEDIQQIISQFEDLEGVVVDVRKNHGGTDPASHRIAGAFADLKRLAYTVQTRNGPEHDDFDEPTRWYVEPVGPQQFTKAMVLITDRATSSAAEIFSILMSSLPHVTHIGDSTGGGFSDVSFDRYLPNGWVYRMSHQLYRGADGKSPEGIGVVPEVYIQNTEADIAAGVDRVLEFAIDYLNGQG